MTGMEAAAASRAADRELLGKQFSFSFYREELATLKHESTFPID